MSARVIGPITLLILLACGTCYSSPASDHPCATYDQAFMGRVGTHFCFDQAEVILYGATIYPYWQHNGTTYRSQAWLQPDFPTYIDSILDMAQEANLNTLRVTDYLNIDRSWDNPKIWKNMDYLIQQAEQRGIWIILDLSAYRKWLENRGLQFWYNPSDWLLFIAWITERYQDSPAIAHYSIAGEIIAPDHGTVTSEQYVRFFKRILEALYDGDAGNHLISIGGLSYLNQNAGIPWRELYSLPHNSIAAIHVYSGGDRTVTLPMVAGWAAANDLPFLIEEFGFQQNQGDSQRANNFQNIFNLARAHGAAGTIFWNLGGEILERSYDVNQNTPLVWQIIQSSSSR